VKSLRGPALQILFAQRLEQIRSVYLHEALGRCVEKLDIALLDRDLHSFVPDVHLAKLAKFSLRGEAFFPVPYLLENCPYLLGYYRLLLGYSRKEFSKGYSPWLILEDKGRIPLKLRGQLPELCHELGQAAGVLVENLDALSPALIHELQLLTLGAQLRGGKNNTLGNDAIKQVWHVIYEIVKPHVKDAQANKFIHLKGNKDEELLITFSSDPDIRITEHKEGTFIKRVAIEVKGGADEANVHNRIGEAEKSHQKAKTNGYAECWTILRAAVDMEKARLESSSTDKFYNLDSIGEESTPEFERFKRDLLEVLGLLARA
jgi:hypothetical protein